MNLRKLLSLVVCGAMIATAGVLAITNSAKTSILHAQHDHDLVHYDAVAATEEHPGNIEYWVCCGCHKSFSDSGALNEIPNTDVSAGKTHIVEGDGRYVPALNVLRNYDPGFNYAPTSFRHNRTAAFDYYPYGNWSDLNGENGGWYYIQADPDDASNYVIKQPAVIWWPGNTTVKKDMSASTAQPGTYEISFDVKVSSAAKTLVNGDGLTGNLVGYCWCDALYDFKFVDLSANWNQRTGELSTTDWTNIRVRYVIPEDTNYAFNQFNLIYWPEGNVGEDNYVLIDNIKVFKVVGGVADESVNLDTIPGGDLEMFNPNNTVQSFDNQYWWPNRDVLGYSGTLMDGENRVYKMGGLPQPVCINLNASDTLATTPGTYKVSLDVKKSAASTMATINFKAWYTSVLDVDNKLMDWQATIDTSSVGTDGYTRVSQYYTIDGNAAAVGQVKVWFCVDKVNGAPSVTLDDYVLIDNISIERVYLD